MYRHYKSDFPNQVHQLLVTVSKHYFVGARNRIRYQKKIIDVSLKNIDKSERENLVYYFLRDHFSGFYYVEVTSAKNIIPLTDFLLRAFLPKPDLAFCGIPVTLMIPKQVEDYFPPVDEILDNLRIQKMYPPSGFASGMTVVKHWEGVMRVPLLPDEGFDDLTFWNPRTSAYSCNIYNPDNLAAWRNGISNVSIPDREYARKTGSSEFKFADEYPLYEPIWKRQQRVMIYDGRL